MYGPSNAPLLRRTAAVMRDRSAIHDGGYLQSGGLQRPNRSFSTCTWSAHEDAHLAHAMLHSLAGGRVGSQARGVWRALARAFEAGTARRTPGEHVAVGIGDGHDGVVEARLD